MTLQLACLILAVVCTIYFFNDGYKCIVRISTVFIIVQPLFITSWIIKVAYKVFLGRTHTTSLGKIASWLAYPHIPNTYTSKKLDWPSARHISLYCMQSWESLLNTTKHNPIPTISDCLEWELNAVRGGSMQSGSDWRYHISFLYCYRWHHFEISYNHTLVTLALHTSQVM